jgi:hypothetical protein
MMMHGEVLCGYNAFEMNYVNVLHDMTMNFIYFQ